MVPKLRDLILVLMLRFRAVLFRMVPKHQVDAQNALNSFRAVLFRMVPKKATHFLSSFLTIPSLHIAHSLIAKENG